jgi:hypothetical protein
VDDSPTSHLIFSPQHNRKVPSGKEEGNSPMRRYRIVVRGEFGDLLSNAFSDTRVEIAQGKTVLTADVADNAGLFGILDRLRNFAVELESFNEVGS